MRDNVKQLIESTPSWRLFSDPTMRDLKAALEIATKDRDAPTVAVLQDMIKQQTELLLKT